jgi:hypothetical protein
VPTELNSQVASSLASFSVGILCKLLYQLLGCAVDFLHRFHAVYYFGYGNQDKNYTAYFLTDEPRMCEKYASGPVVLASGQPFFGRRLLSAPVGQKGRQKAESRRSSTLCLYNLPNTAVTRPSLEMGARDLGAVGLRSPRNRFNGLLACTPKLLKQLQSRRLHPHLTEK